MNVSTTLKLNAVLSTTLCHNFDTDYGTVCKDYIVSTMYNDYPNDRSSGLYAHTYYAARSDKRYSSRTVHSKGDAYSNREYAGYGAGGCSVYETYDYNYPRYKGLYIGNTCPIEASTNSGWYWPGLICSSYHYQDWEHAVSGSEWTYGIYVQGGAWDYPNNKGWRGIFHQINFQYTKGDGRLSSHIVCNTCSIIIHQQVRMTCL